MVNSAFDARHSFSITLDGKYRVKTVCFAGRREINREGDFSAVAPAAIP
ncbi:MAG: hypothetical protein LBG43_02900 [Treponema sp.]|jgi:hypothetical protein|nr:hypothetical protein [Treponema sp.]